MECFLILFYQVRFFPRLFFCDNRFKSEHFFFNDRGKNQHRDKVRNSHERIGDIRQVPYEVECLCRPHIDDKGKRKAVDDIVCMGAPEIFPCFSPLYSQPRMVE